MRYISVCLEYRQFGFSAACAKCTRSVWMFINSSDPVWPEFANSRCGKKLEFLERTYYEKACQSHELAWLHNYNKAVLEPRVSPDFAITYFCNHCNIRFENTDQSIYVDTLTLFSKNLNQRSLTPRWPLTPCLLRSHVWLYPRIIVSKSPWQYINVCGYSDQFCKIPHYIHIHTYIHILHTEWVIT